MALYSWDQSVERRRVVVGTALEKRWFNNHTFTQRFFKNLLLISVLPSPPPRPADIGSELVSDTQIAGHGLRGTIPTFSLHCGDQFDHGGLVIINSNTAHSPVDGTGHKLYSLAGFTGFKVYIFKHDGEDEFLV